MSIAVAEEARDGPLADHSFSSVLNEEEHSALKKRLDAWKATMNRLKLPPFPEHIFGKLVSVVKLPNSLAHNYLETIR